MPPSGSMKRPAAPAANRTAGSAESSGSKTKVIAALAVAAILLVVVVGGLFVMMSGPQSEPSPSANAAPQRPGLQTQPANRASPPIAQTQTFTLEVAEGQAEVFKNGERIGTTPYQFQAKPGEQVDVVLKRDGFHDKTVQMSLSENKRVYTFAMEKKLAAN